MSGCRTLLGRTAGECALTHRPFSSLQPGVVLCVLADVWAPQQSGLQSALFDAIALVVDVRRSALGDDRRQHASCIGVLAVAVAPDSFARACTSDVGRNAVVEVVGSCIGATLAYFRL